MTNWIALLVALAVFAVVWWHEKRAAHLHRERLDAELARTYPKAELIPFEPRANGHPVGSSPRERRA